MPTLNAIRKASRYERIVKVPFSSETGRVSSKYATLIASHQDFRALKSKFPSILQFNRAK